MNMTFLTRRGRSYAAPVMLAAALGTAATLTVATPAQAVASGCDIGQRSTASYWASTGQFSTPRVYEWNDGTAHNKVELRYNAAARCVWALYNGGKAATVYVDRSTDGGRSWEGWLYPQGPSTSVYTGVIPDQSPRTARACANYGGRSWCTGWW